MSKRLDPQLNVAPCLQPNCTSESKRRHNGWCQMHYTRLRDGSPAMDAPARPYRFPRVSSSRCKVEGCERLARINIYCEPHRRLVSTNPELGVVEDRICSIDGLPANRSGLCKRHYRIFYSYGWKAITALLVFAANGCAICGNKDRAPHIDHDHSCCGSIVGKGVSQRTCGKCIRGALCNLCNVGLGSFDDDPSKMTKAMAYLQKWEVK